MADDTDSFLPIHPVAGIYRLRLNSPIVEAMGWLSQSDPFQCVGLFRSDGELLCAAKDASTENGTHPLDSALRYRQEHDQALKARRLEEVPALHALAMRYLVFEFTAARVSELNKQIDLKLGEAHISLLGWTKAVQPPIYPFPLPPILCLVSQRKLEAMQRAANLGSDAGGELVAPQ